MPTDALVDRLVHDLKPVRRQTAAGEAVMVAALCLSELALFLALGEMRPDMPTALAEPSFWWKLVSLGLIAALGGGVAVVSFDPVRSPRRGLRWLMALILLALASGWLVDAAQTGLPGLAARVNWREGVPCVASIVVLSVPPIIGLGLLMRRGAPTDAGGSALAIGLSAAAWGAFVFVFSCPYDDPLYVAIWYAIAGGAITVTARLMLPWLTRW